MMTREELAQSPIFQGISYESYLAMVDCFHARTKTYQNGEIILSFGEGSQAVGIVEEGSAALLRIDADGNSTILEVLDPGGVFGETIAFSGVGGDSLMVVCRKSCRVLFIDYEHITKRCEKACEHHSVLVQNMLRLIAHKALALGERVEVLSQRSIRDKLAGQQVRMVITGSAGLGVAKAAEIDFVQEVYATAAAVNQYIPDTGSSSTCGRRVRWKWTAAMLRSAALSFKV